MATTCSREMSITVESGLPQPLAYYKVDSAAGITIPDSVAGLDLTVNVGSANFVPGKIGNAINSVAGTFRASRTDAVFDLAGVDFTLRLWVKPLTATPNEVLMTIQNAGPPFTFTEIGIVDGPVRIGMDMKPVATGIHDIFAPVPGTVIGWHHVIAWHRNGVEFGLRIDNGAPIVAGYNLGLNNTSILHIRCDNDMDIDELTIWKGIVLTTAEQDADWNGGNGVTYPF